MNLKLFLIGAGLFVAAGSQAYVYNTFTTWGTNDSVLGITGYTIEDFEDVNIVAGLMVGSTTSNGSYGPTSTLPNTFKPSDDGFGTAFSFGGGGVWDGAHGMISTRTNQTFSYSESGSWGSIDLFFGGTGATSLGFSLQQVEADNHFWINGVDQGVMSVLTPAFARNGGQQGYLRIDAGSDAPITSFSIRNVQGDGYMIDHVAFAQPVPEPTSMLALGLGGLAMLRRRRKS